MASKSSRQVGKSRSKECEVRGQGTRKRAIWKRKWGNFHLLFLLRDTGCGISPADLPHVFEKFYHGQARPGEKARKATGLGLYTCKLLVEKHGGTLAIQNHPAGGCEVAFCLPLNAAHGSFAGESAGQPISSLRTE
jgi:signal transduction histidine kinase